VKELKREMADQGFVPNKVFKRTNEGKHNIPLLNGQSLYRLISRVFYGAGRKGKLLPFGPLTEEQAFKRVDISVKVKLRVLTSIGPRSGL
jgi:hypothetical protein